MFTTFPLTAAVRKAVASLAKAKGRREYGAFMAQGTKCVLDTVEAFDVLAVYALPSWLDEHKDVAGERLRGRAHAVCRADLERMTSLATAPDVIAVYRLPDAREVDSGTFRGSLVLALDGIQDPGNLGTIIRLADWFGIHTVMCSADTADCYAPKVVQATMGAIARVRVVYCPSLPEALHSVSAAGTPVYGTFLDGENLYTASLDGTGVVVIGNEGHGISPQVAAEVGQRLTIPSFGPTGSESLNAAVAAALTVAEFRRRSLSLNVKPID